MAAELRERFDALGFRARRLEFSFSTLPGTYGLPAAGAILMATGGLSGWLLGSGSAGPALATAVVGLLAAGSPLLFLDAALERLPWGRVRTANWLFVRQDPRWIVMAHRDTKSQPVPTLVRTLALTVALVAWVAVTAVAVVDMAGGVQGGGAPFWPAGALVAAGAVLLASPAGNTSPGALDNGTGLAVLLALGERTGPEVGFLVTDGEELGLAGARAAVDRLPEVAGIINLDGLDDQGPIRIAETRAGKRSEAGAVAASLLEDARRLGMAAVRRPVPPFIRLDHEPLAAAGRPALTILKGRWRSLLRIHRPGDTVDRLTGAGAAAVVELVATTLGTLTAGDDHTLRPGERSGHSPAP